MNELPSILYHGRPDYRDTIPPEQAFDAKLNPKDNLFAIYASHIYDVAVPYAFGIASKKFNMLKFGDPGYGFYLDAKYFEPIDSVQWISTDFVVPLKFDIVYKIEYLHVFLNKHVSMGRIFKINRSVWTKKKDIDKLIEGTNLTTIDDEKAIEIAKNILHKELVKLKTQFDNKEIDGNVLRAFLEKLDANWYDYIQ